MGLLLLLLLLLLGRFSHVRLCAYMAWSTCSLSPVPGTCQTSSQHSLSLCPRHLQRDSCTHFSQPRAVGLLKACPAPALSQTP